MCLGGILAAERPELASEVRSEVERFTQILVDWLTQVLTIGLPKLSDKTRKQRAFSIFAAIEGAQLVARGCSDVAVFDDVIETYRSVGLLP